MEDSTKMTTTQQENNENNNLNFVIAQSFKLLQEQIWIDMKTNMKEMMREMMREENEIDIHTEDRILFDEDSQEDNSSSNNQGHNVPHDYQGHKCPTKNQGHECLTNTSRDASALTQSEISAHNINGSDNTSTYGGNLQFNKRGKPYW